MIFSSTIFIFAFLPCVLFGNYVLFRKWRKAQNVFLLCVSLLFYAWGEPSFVLIMIASILINWFFALKIQRIDTQKLKKVFLIAAIIIDISLLFVFKYLMFTLENLNLIFGTDIAIPSITLPIGISFFTFQAMSYVIDVYRGDGEAQRNPLNVGLYISFFPQLIAGPIVRYETVADQIENRKETLELFSSGVCRFIVGFAKKTIIANTVSVIADLAFGTEYNSVAMAWLGAISYMLQIYFDFSGYSDMAIGLGRMFGFEFLENFNYPYISLSISDFWRRWHISMGTCFRDYVYFPLGGSRVKTKFRLFFNLFVVWFLTGLWHGANWTFIIWGLIYFTLISFEKIIKFEKRNIPKVLCYIYTMVFVLFGWIIFRSDSLGQAIDYIGQMFNFSGILLDSTAKLYFTENIFILILGILCSFPIVKVVDKYWTKCLWLKKSLYFIGMIMILLISLAYTVKGTYNPFIYFKF